MKQINEAELRRVLARYPTSGPDADAEMLAVVVEDLPELLRVYGEWQALHRDCDASPCKWPCLRDDFSDWLAMRANGDER